MIPQLDHRLDPIELILDVPFNFQLLGKEFGWNPWFDVARKCNELGLNGLRVTKITDYAFKEFHKDNTYSDKIKFILEVEPR